MRFRFWRRHPLPDPVPPLRDYWVSARVDLHEPALPDENEGGPFSPKTRTTIMAGAMPTDSNITQAVPFFGVRNMEASLRFYTDGLGGVMTTKWIDEGKLRWCWIEIGGAGVMLQELRPEFVPEGKFGNAMSICFMCRDAIAYYKELRSRGLDARRPFVGNGLWVTQVTDPDGYELYFESPTDAPEESEYSE